MSGYKFNFTPSYISASKLIVEKNGAVILELVVEYQEPNQYTGTIAECALEELDARLRLAIFKSLIAHLDLLRSGHPYSLKIGDGAYNLVSEDVKEEYNFASELGYLQTTRSESKKLIAVKKEIFNRVSTAEKIGRGYSIDTSDIDFDVLNQLSVEYNSLAWGNTGWAAHASVAPDEIAIADKYLTGSVLEIGAGLGRVSDYLVKISAELTLSDYVPEIAANLEKRYADCQHVKTICSDITSEVPGRYQSVCFFENGLGNILNEGLRRKAVQNMCACTVAGGVVILAVRSLGESTDHAMVASMDNAFVGIYHTFSELELKSYFEDQRGNVQIIEGGPRPAGGKELFAIFTKAI